MPRMDEVELTITNRTARARLRSSDSIDIDLDDSEEADEDNYLLSPNTKSMKKFDQVDHTVKKK